MSAAALSFALVGAPNIGKTVLFNGLTGSNAKVANYAGVTVDKRSGYFINDQNVEIVDLPGTYSLRTTSPDEAVTRDVILGKMDQRPDAVIAVADATNLRMTLRMVLELKTLGLPMVVSLNLSDVARARGLKINVDKLSELLGVPVVETVAIKAAGINNVCQEVKKLSAGFGAKTTTLQAQDVAALESVLDNLDSQALYDEVERVLNASLEQKMQLPSWHKTLDNIVLHPIFGLPILLLILLLVFQAVYAWSEPVMDSIEGAFGLLGEWLGDNMAEGLLRDLLVDGVIAGVGGVLVFLPQITILFAFILLLEDSGYLPRAAFMLDNLLAKTGLSGRSFIPLLSSFACAVPGVMVLLFFLLVCCVQLLPAQTDTLATHHLSEATVKAARLLFVSKGDTLVYDLDALTLENNATLGQALLALPGVDMRKGELYYKGKKVDRLLVNDFDFSISDPQRALSQLPAYLMKQVKAYERLPDKQRRMGYDDGQREVVLNVLVRRKYMGVWTGQATVGAGTSARWETRGYANTFVPRWRISAFGNANNIGRELWYSGDGREVPGSNGSTGKNQYVAPGLTFMCNSGKQEYTPGYWKVDISADYNDNQTYQASRQEEEMFLDKAHRYTAQRSESRGGERRWAGHSSFVWTPHAKSTVAYDANVYINRLHSNLNGLSGEWTSNPFLPAVNVLDILQQNEEAWPAQMILHRKLARQRSGDEGVSFDHSLSANYTFSSSFQVDVRHMLISEQNQGEDFSLDSYRYYSSLTKPKELFHRYRQRDNSSLFTSSCFDFHLVLGRGFVLGATYDLRTNTENDRVDGFRLDRLQGTPFAQFSMDPSLLGTLPTSDYPDWKESTFDETISRRQPSRELTHRANAWLRYTWGKNHLSLSFDHPWQYVSMDYTQGKQTTQHWQETRRQK